MVRRQGARFGHGNLFLGPRAIGSAAGMYFPPGEIGAVLGPLTVGYMFDVGGGFTAAL